MKKEQTQVINEFAGFEHAIDKLGQTQGRSFSESLEDFLDCYLTQMCGNPDEHYKNKFRRILKDDVQRQAFAEAMIEYGKAAEDYRDPLGEVYMLRVSNGDFGQYFTPKHICDLMAKMSEGEKAADTLYDSACGSGRLLLSGLRHSRKRGVEPVIHANDIALTCVKMALANFLSNGAIGEVTLGSALEDDDKKTHYLLDRVVVDGCVMPCYWRYTTDNKEQVLFERMNFYSHKDIQSWEGI